MAYAIEGSGRRTSGYSIIGGLVGQRIAGQRVAQFRDSADIARVQLVERENGFPENRADVREPLVDTAERAFIRCASFFSTPEMTLK